MKKIDKETICIMTGATNGIGRVAVFKLFESIQNLHLIYGARDVEKGKTLLEEVKAQFPNAKVECLQLELASFKSVRNFVKEFHTRNLPLHLLLMNGGINTRKFVLTEDGLESTIQVNHFSHFLLTQLLMNDLKQSAPSRIVVVASEVHIKGAVWGPDPDLRFTKEEWNTSNFNGMKQYKSSKLANVMFVNTLARKLKGTNIKVASLCPGFIPDSGLGRELGWLGFFLKPIFKMLPIARTLDHGAKMLGMSSKAER